MTTLSDERVVLITPREYEVAQAVWSDLHGKEIARRLGISLKTVDSHLVSLRRKLGVHSRVGIALAVERKQVVVR